MAFAYNTSYHSSTAFSPLYLLYLREAPIPIDLALKTVGEAVPAEWDDYVTEVRSRMERTFQTVRDQLCHAFQRVKQVYDGRVKKLQFKVEDLVWFFCPRKRPRLGPKWHLLTTGPRKVERVLNSVNYVIRRVGRRDRRVVHVDRLQRYVEAPQMTSFQQVSRDQIVKICLVRQSRAAESQLIYSHIQWRSRRRRR